MNITATVNHFLFLCGLNQGTVNQNDKREIQISKLACLVPFPGHGNLQDDMVLLQRTGGGGLMELSAEELLAEDEEDTEPGGFFGTKGMLLQ